MGSENYHVTQRKDGKWQVKKEGSSRASVVADTQKEAIETGKTLAQKQGTELLIHGQDGKIRDRNSYDDDSCSSRG